MTVPSDELKVIDREGDGEVWVCSALDVQNTIMTSVGSRQSGGEHQTWIVADEEPCPTMPTTHRHYHLVKKPVT